MALSAVLLFVSLVLMAAAAITLWWMMHAWRTPETLEATAFAEPDGEHRLSFSLLVPARHEEAILSNERCGVDAQPTELLGGGAPPHHDAADRLTGSQRDHG